MRRMIGLLLGIACGAGAAQEPERVIDLHAGMGPAVGGMQANGLRADLVLGGVRYFSADDGAHGTELWRSDGTTEGTWMVRDIHRGAGGSVPSEMTAFGSGFCFAADDGSSGVEPWCSDGTAEGTRRLADLWPGTRGSAPRDLIEHAGRLYFSAEDGSFGRELWSTDGSTGGTALVLDIEAGAASSRPEPLGSIAAGLLFGASVDSSAALWRTDGSAAGTVVVYEYVEPSSRDSATHGNRVYFADRYGDAWRSDGTEDGTDSLFLDNGFVAQDAGGFTSTPLGVVFWADTESGRALWCASGSFAEAMPAPSGATVVTLKGELFFPAGSPARLWRSDCTTAGTSEIPNEDGHTQVSVPTVLGDALYFRASTPAHGRELYRYQYDDPSGAQRVTDLAAGSAQGDPTRLVVLGNHLQMSADDGTHGKELWQFVPGTGATLLRNIAVDAASSRPRIHGIVDGMLVFSAYHEATGRELWASDGTAAGTVLLDDTLPGTGDGIRLLDDRHLQAVLHDGHLYYSAYSSALGEELWRTDGTAAGTGLVADLCAGACDGMGRHPGQHSMVSAGSLLYFAASAQGAAGAAIWRSDGSAAGTWPVRTDVTLWSDGVQPLAVLGERVLFSGEDAENREAELWISDGSAAGTTLVHRIGRTYAGSEPDWLTAVGDWVYFAATDQDGGRELWRSNGSADATQRVADIVPGSGDANPYRLAAHHGELFFVATDGSSGYELWRSDGTAAGTVRTADIHAGPRDAYPSALTSTAGYLFFAANDGSTGAEPWRTDGLANGTQRPVDIVPGPSERLPAPFAGVPGLGLNAYRQLVPMHAGVADYAAPTEFVDVGDGRVAFRGCDAEAGCQVWTSDGTAVGTRRLTTLEAGPGGAAPGHLTVLGDTLYFAANESSSGRELWKIVLPERVVEVFHDGFEARN